MKNRENVSGSRAVEYKIPNIIEINESQNRIEIGKKTMVMLVGLPGSGKSTFAYNNFPMDSVISTDRLRHELTGNIHNQVISSKAFLLARKIAETRLKEGEISVLDAQNLTEARRNEFYEIAKKAGAKVVTIFLNVSPEMAAERDTERKRHAGADYIKSKKSEFAAVKRSLEKSRHIDTVYIVDPEAASSVSVELPQEYIESREADRELMKEAEVAETILGYAEIGLLKKENMESRESVSVPSGSLITVRNIEQSKTSEFLDYNFMSHQVIDVLSVARRLSSDVSDQAVNDVVSYLVKERTKLNLTSVLSYPSEFDLDKVLARVEKKSKDGNDGLKLLVFPVNQASVNRKDFINVERGFDLKEEPLFLIGDVQGCLTAVQELAGKIKHENYEGAHSDEEYQKRKIVFVGDMADRGPYDAEAVIYISALVRQGRAVLVRGNHDDNLLKVLKGNLSAGSRETNKTAKELRERLSQRSIEKVIEMLEAAPSYIEWKNLAVVHASLPRMPLTEKDIEKDSDKHIHGIRGDFAGGRRPAEKLKNVVAKDPGILVVGGHTHDEPPAHVNMISGTVGLDLSTDLRGVLYGMYYPELQFLSAEEPSVVNLHKIMEGGALPSGQDLLALVRYADELGMIETKQGIGEYAGLTIINYSRTTDASGLWEKLPTLRHFRGLIIDSNGSVVARPFEKTHKAGIEIPLEELNIVPEKVFEKANGSMGIVYFWNGKWRVSTKFSFENNNFTKPAQDLLDKMNKDKMDPAKTYLFEIILPDEAHIVDYGNEKSLILLNAVNKETGVNDEWSRVEAAANYMGTRAAVDLTGKFKGMTIAQIYEYAQQEGTLENLEGLMAQYRDKDGKIITVKVKTRGYDDKKFVRDQLDWEKLVEEFNKETLDIDEDKREKLLKYNFDNTFANATLETRITWMRDRVNEIVNELRDLLVLPSELARLKYEENIEKGMNKTAALRQAAAAMVPDLEAYMKASKTDKHKGDVGYIISFLKSVLSDESEPETKLRDQAFKIVKEEIEAEEKRRPKNSFWLVPGK
ncbi:MAG: AAA family ATPase [Candidatus Vogelbacteria bacterium]|nr:AAA family ATPase [Candidatus Vogelbacteria bacterium]